MGGVACGRDAFEFILAGASAVSVGTALFHDPSACARISWELRELLAQRGIARLSDAVGLAHERHGEHLAAQQARLAAQLAELEPAASTERMAH
jgi:hypothetical protein